MTRYGYRSRLRALILVVLGVGLSPLAIVAAHAHRQWSLQASNMKSVRPHPARANRLTWRTEGRYHRKSSEGCT